MQNSKYFRNSFLSKMPTVNIVQGARSLPQRFMEGLGNIRESMSKFDPGAWWEKQIRIATGDYYAGQVDENQNEPIGVYLEDIEASERYYYPEDSVKIWASLSAKTLDDEPIFVTTACFSNTTLGKIDQSEIRIDSLEKEDIQCTFPPNTFIVEEGEEEDFFDIEVMARFNFITLSYLKTYFMDKTRQRALVRDGKDPLSEYGITDKNPVGIYTNGPVMIGMETTTPLIGLYQTGSETRDFKLGLTISNRWDGIVANITNFELQIPEEMSIVPDSCDKSIIEGETDVTILNMDFTEGYVTYHIDPDELKSIRAFDDFESINCRIRVDSVGQTLGDTPISTKYFRAIIGYDYQLEEKIKIEVKESDLNTGEYGADEDDGESGADVTT